MTGQQRFDVIVIFSHPYPGNVNRLRAWYERFGDVCIVTPPDGGGDAVFEVGSFCWQAAVVAALRARPRQHEHTLVVHDDLFIAPNADLHGLLGDNPTSAAITHRGLPIAGASTKQWMWMLDAVVKWGCSNLPGLGVGTDDCRSVLTQSLMYRARPEMVEQLPQSWVVVDPDGDPYHAWAAAHAHQVHRDDGIFRFGLPLSAGYADYFTFPNRIEDEVEDFLARTVRCGMFCETAVPTMFAWSGLRLVDCSAQFDVRWGDRREDTEFASLSELERYFAQHPEILGVHPVKTSRFRD